MNEKNTQNVIPNVNSKKKEERNVPDLGITYKLKDIAKIYDGTHQTPNYKTAGIPFVSVENIHSIYEFNKFITKEAYELEFNKNHPIKGDILMTRIGDIGTPALITKDIDIGYYVSLARISLFNKVLPEYMYFYIQTSQFQHELWKKTIHVAFPKKINKEDIGECKVKLYSTNKQKEISKILMAIENRILTQKKIIECYKSFMKSISNIILSAEVNMKLGDICEIKKGTQLNSKDFDNNGIYPVINGGVNISGYSNNFNSENMITISEGGNSCGYVNYFKGKFWSGGHNYTLTKKSNFIYDYLFHYLKYKEKDIMSLRVGSGLPNIQKTAIINFSIYIPDIDSQTRIANILNSILDKIQNEKSILSLYIKEKEYLLNKLFI